MKIIEVVPSWSGFFIGGMYREEEKEANQRSAEAASSLSKATLGRMDRNKAILQKDISP